MSSRTRQVTWGMPAPRPEPGRDAGAPARHAPGRITPRVALPVVLGAEFAVGLFVAVLR